MKAQEAISKEQSGRGPDSPAVRTEEALRSVATSRYNPPVAIPFNPDAQATLGLGAGVENSAAAATAAADTATATAATTAVVATSMSLSTASTAAPTGTGMEGGGASSWLDEVGPDGRRRRRSKKQVCDTPD